MSQKVLAVPEVHCGHCVSSIEGAVAQLDGVETVKVDLGERNVTIDFDDNLVGLDQIVGAIEGQGYDVGDGPKVIPLSKP